MDKQQITKVLKILSSLYPRGERPWMGGSDPFHTVIATVMSAQTTDAQVDTVTPELFRRYPSPAKLGAARMRDVERIIKPVGLHKTKAKNIVAAARMIAGEYGGRVPDSREELVKLPGVGRKTANVVLIKAFGEPAMPVDTHVFRVSNRIGLAKGKTPEKVEAGLERAIPRGKLGAAHFWLIHHGRTLCTARSPKCRECPISRYCEYAREEKKAKKASRGSGATG